MEGQLENLSLVDVSNLPEQRSAVLWKKAQQALATYPEENLLRESDGESYYVMTPPLSLAGKKYKELEGVTFSVAAIVNTPDAKQIPAGSPTYLVLNGNILRPLLQFDKYSMEPVRLLSMEGGSLEDGRLDEVVDLIARKASEVKEYKESERRKEHQRRRRTALAVGTVASLGAVGLGIFGGIHYFLDKKHEAERLQVEQFDGRHIHLPGQVISTGETGYAGSDPALFGGFVPSLGSRVLDSPRQFSINDASCVQEVTVPKGTEIVAASDAPAETVILSVNSSGNIQACALSDGDDNKKTEYHIAIQTR